MSAFLLLLVCPFLGWVFGRFHWMPQGSHAAINAWVLAALIALHLSAVLFYLIVKRDNLIAPMIHGRKRGITETASPRQAGVWRALAILALSGLAVAGLVNI